MEEIMNKFTSTTKLDFRTLKYCNLFLIKYRRKAGIWFLVTAVLSVGIAIYDILVIKSQYYMFAILAAAFVAYSLYQMFTVEKKLDQSLVRFFANRTVSSQTIELDDEHVTVTRSLDPTNPTVYDWAHITEINEMPQYYMLMVGKNAPIIIDRSADNIIEGTLEDLDAIIKAKTATKPYKMVDIDIVKIPITYVHQEPIPQDAQEVKAEEPAEEAKPEQIEEPKAEDKEEASEDKKE